MRIAYASSFMQIAKWLALSSLVLLAPGCSGDAFDLDMGNVGVGCAGALESCGSAQCCGGLACYSTGDGKGLCMSTNSDRPDAGNGWTFSVTRRWGDCAETMETCANGHTYYEHRVLAHDGLLKLHSDQNPEWEVTVSPEDLATVTAAVESEVFVQKMTDGFGCPAVESEESFELALHFDRDTFSYHEEVTGCVQTDAPNQPRDLHALLAAY